MSNRVKASLVQTCDVDEDCVLVFTQDSWNRIEELGRLRCELEDILLVNTLALYHDICCSLNSTLRRTMTT